MKLDPRHLEAVAAIVDAGGLTEGAARLSRAQPSMSRTLSELEARIGAPLFVPGKRPLQPTDLGLALAEEGRRILAASEAASAQVQLYRSGRSGVVRIGGTPIFMDGVVSGMIAGFQTQNPGVRIEQSYGYAKELEEGLIRGTLDLAICPMRPDGVPERLVFDAILPGRNVIACRAGHPLARRKGVTLAALSAFAWIAPSADSPLFRDLKLVLDGLGAEAYKISFSGGSLSAVLGFLTGSDALTVLPYSVVFTLRKQHALAALSIRINHPDRSLGLLTRPDVAPSPVTRRLRSHIAAQFHTLAETIRHHETNSLWR